MSSAPTSTDIPTTRLEVTRDGMVATVTFVADEGPPLISSPLLGELGRAVEQLSADACIRYVVFRGRGTAFNHGADIREIVLHDEDQGYALSKHGTHVFDAIENMPQITFAALNGDTLGGGCQLALACSFRIAVETAQLGFPEVKLGLIPGWGATQRLPMLVPLNWALLLLYSGDSIPATQAKEIGLVDEVVASEAELDPALGRWFERFSHCAPQAIIRIKRAILSKDEPSQFSLAFRCPDAKEGMRAYLEGREPQWQSTAHCSWR